MLSLRKVSNDNRFRNCKKWKLQIRSLRGSLKYVQLATVSYNASWWVQLATSPPDQFDKTESSLPYTFRFETWCHCDDVSELKIDTFRGTFIRVLLNNTWHSSDPPHTDQKSKIWRKEQKINHKMYLWMLFRYISKGIWGLYKEKRSCFSCKWSLNRALDLFFYKD